MKVGGILTEADCAPDGLLFTFKLPGIRGTLWLEEILRKQTPISARFVSFLQCRILIEFNRNSSITYGIPVALLAIGS